MFRLGYEDEVALTCLRDQSDSREEWASRNSTWWSERVGNSKSKCKKKHSFSESGWVGGVGLMVRGLKKPWRRNAPYPHLNARESKKARMRRRNNCQTANPTPYKAQPSLPKALRIGPRAIANLE